jgi:hypothetical protein
VEVHVMVVSEWILPFPQHSPHSVALLLIVIVLFLLL